MSCFDVPAAETAGKRVDGMLKIETFFLSANDNGIAVQQVVFTGRAKGTDIINPENAPVRPGDGAGLHIAGGIKIGRDLNIYPVRHRKHPPLINS